MRKRFGIGLAVVAVAGMLVVPSAGRAADLLPNIGSAECTGVITAPGTGSCATEFTLNAPGFVSNVDTHGNFHELLSQNGGVRLTWTDAAGNVVYQADCASPGASLDGVGPFDIQSAECTNRVLSSTYVEGTQTLRVDAATDGCLNSDDCTFHGKIVFSDPDSLL